MWPYGWGTELDLTLVYFHFGGRLGLEAVVLDSTGSGGISTHV